jgi:hypothetical protein
MAIEITNEGLALNGARLAGQIATELLAKARDNRLNVNNYYKGVHSLPAVSPSGNNTYNGQTGIATPDTPLYKSDIGTDVFADVTFGSVTYTDRIGKIITTPSLTFQAILISLSFPRNIVKTEIQGRDGTVKEYIGEGDANISFRGVITGSNGVYPADEVEQLRQVIKAPTSIPVTCTFLNDKDIYNVVFEDRTLDQSEGGYSYQTFVLQAISDIPQELLITGN